MCSQQCHLGGARKLSALESRFGNAIFSARSAPQATHINSEHSVVATLPRRGLGENQALGEKSQKHALGEEHERLALDGENAAAEVEVQAREQRLVGVDARSRIARRDRGDWVHRGDRVGGVGGGHGGGRLLGWGQLGRVGVGKDVRGK